MPIVNKGIFDTDVVFQRQIDTDWPEANTNFDLYVQDLIASGNLIANGLIVRNFEVTDDILTGNVIASTVTANTLVLDTLTSNSILVGSITANTYNNLPAANLNGLTTDNLEEGSNNLYFTLERARDAYREGSGISISANGFISTRGDDTGIGLFNSGLSLAANLKPTGTYQNIKTFPAVEGNTFIVFSFLATNRSSNISYISAGVNADGDITLLANLLKLPPNSSVEIFRKPQVFRVGDSIQVLSLNQNQIPEANLINTYISYQGTLNDSFNRSIISISDNEPYVIYQSPSVTSIVESLNLVNLNSNTMPVDVFITNDYDELVTYLVSNLVIPPYTSVEICEYPKALLDDDKIWIQKWDNPKEMSVFLSSKVTSSYIIEESTLSLNEGETIVFDIVTTNVLDGTVLYYEIEQVFE